MLKKIKDYSILEIINETSSSIVYRARRDGQDATRVIKKLKKNRSSQIDIARFRQEYDIIKSIDNEGVIKVFDCIDLDDEIALVLEDFNGIQLKSIIYSSPLALLPFLNIAVSLASTLGNLHLKNIIHKDIKPQNILVNMKKNIYKISDFGISKVITHDDEEIYDQSVIEGTLIYMSPEQTGRMNRPVDYRSDLYSLGVTFYEMLIGEVPFKFKDPMEVIYAHIAHKPVPLCSRNTSIPEVLSNIIMKLLYKNAEERYQNSFGLMADLEECLQQYEKTGIIKSFELAANDTSITFNIPQKFFGRDKEINLIMTAFERVCQSGKSEMMLVSGNPGIGKSALINEINKPMTGRKGYFISGKYDQFRKDVPYSAIIQAFIGLVQQILTENRDRINEWKNVLLTGLGPNGRIITDIIPAIELIIGTQPEVPSLGADESNNRFVLVFNNFVRIFANSEHPLVIFLDDLQWADLASLTLIRNIMIDPDTQNIFFIGSYRNNEVNSAHPFILTIEEIRKEELGINTIDLAPLEITAVNRMISNFLRSDEIITLPLTELIHKKTLGNPFFINQFMKTLYDEKALILESGAHLNKTAVSRGGWSWDIEKISKMKVTDNVVELMAEQISRLPAQTQESLKIAACIGSWFDLVTVSMIQKISIDNALFCLSKAINEGLIVPQGQKYFFYHDRIQEAAYSLIPQEEKSIMHTRIGKLLLEKTDSKDLHDKILYIVNQLNEGAGLLNTENERLELARLNLLAGKKAKTSVAYRSALHYATTGIVLINHPEIDNKDALDKISSYCWEKWYDLSLSLYSEAAESAYLCSEYNEMNTYADAVLSNARNIFDKVQVYEAQMSKFMAQNRLIDAVAIGMEALKFFKIRFPKKPTKLHLILNLIKTKFSIFGRSVDEIYNLPEMTDPEILLAMRLLNSCVSPAYWGKPELVPLLIFKFLSLSLKYGNCSYSPYAYAGYGLMLCSIGSIENGYAFGRMSQQLLEKLDARQQKSRASFVFNQFIKHRKEHLKEAQRIFIEGYKAGLETGDIEFAVFNIMVYCSRGYYLGKELTGHENDTAKYCAIAESLKQKTQLQIMKLYHQILLNLLGDKSDAFILKGPVYDEEKMLPLHISANDKPALSFFHLNKAILCYLFHENQKALASSQFYEENIGGALGQITVVHHYFYNSLIYLSLYKNVPRNKKNLYLKKAVKNVKVLKKWAFHAPMNHQHKVDLVLAEIASVKGNFFKAALLYDESIKGAHENEYINEEALSCERAAIFYMETGLHKIAASYLADAIRCYNKWGAIAKVRHLEKKYPDYIQRDAALIKSSIDGTTTVSTGNTNKSLDISTVIKAAQTLSSEIHLDRLLKKMLGFAMENAGAEHGLMIMEKDGRLFIEADGTIGGEITVMQSVEVNDCTQDKEGSDTNCRLPHSIINYIYRTGENIVLDDASHKGVFTSDPYIRNNKVRSLLCSRIMDKGKTAGIIYLENNLTAGAFTPERVELLTVLSAQAAISLENARLLTIETEKAAMDREIEMAKNIQQSLLPKEIPHIKNAQVAFKYVPMTGVGGDFVNVRYIPDSGKLGFFICDVSGHGVPAAMTASIISAALDFYWNDLIDDPARIFTQMQIFLNGKMGGNFFTACLCTLDLESGILTVASAGHPKLILMKSGKNAEMAEGRGRFITDFIKSNSTNELITMEEGDRIVLYTDGVTEAENPQREMLGIDDDRYCSLIMEQSQISNTPEAMCENIYRMVIDFTGSAILQDDVTVLVCDYGKK